MQLNFNAQEVQPASADFEPIPAGWYQAVIEKAEFLPLNNGNGSRISFQARIQGPTNANRVVFGSINYQHNTSPQAQEIGQRQLSALCHSINVMNLQNVQQLCNVPFEGRVKVVAPQYNVKGDPSSGIQYEAKNEFQGFRAVGAGDKTAAGSASAPAASAPQSAPQSRPQSAPQSAPVQQTAPAAQTAVVDPVDPAVLAMAQQLLAQQQQQQQQAPAENTGAATTELPKQPW
jgi:hypothetical protein